MLVLIPSCNLKHGFRQNSELKTSSFLFPFLDMLRIGKGELHQCFLERWPGEWWYFRWQMVISSKSNLSIWLFVMFQRPFLGIYIRQVTVVLFYILVVRLFCCLYLFLFMRIKSAEESIPIIVACKVHFLSEINIEICISKIMSSLFVKAESSSKCHFCEDEVEF